MVNAKAKNKDVKKTKKTDVKTEKIKENTKHPKEGSMLTCILEKFPSEGEFTMDEILSLIREENQDMQSKKDSSLRTVVKELVKEPEPAKGSPHINRYACLKFDKESKKYQRA